ncbi:MAG: SurA N-terminal domain-containing protein, partial [Halioglobus sp.]|nr:SurA N-terminal domain-containing protein [Halioglobus sp.]
MLQNIRQNVQGTAAKIVVGLIVISFSIFGIESILVGGGGNSVAEVNGEEIDAQEVQQAITAQQRRLITMMGDDFNPALLDEDRIRPQVMEALIGRRLLTQSATDLGLSVSEASIGATIGGMPQFQVDGAFSPALYKQLLSDNGYTPGYFKSSLRNDLLANQVRAGLAGSDFATPAELELNASIINEQRDFRYLTIPRETVQVDRDVSEKDIAAYYAENQARYLTEESVDVQYIELQLDDFREPVAEEAIIEAYELARHDFKAVTENSVSHILFEAGDAESQRARAAEAQASLDAGQDFAEVAEQFSDDIGSAARGGDLGTSRGDAFPEEMEAVIANLAPGEVSEPFETDAGLHIVLLRERRVTDEATLEEMRPQLEQALQTDEARAGLLGTVGELRDLSFNAENLDGPARELGLEVEEAPGVTRTAGTGLFADAVLREAAFSDEVLDAGHNSEVFELSDGHFAVLHVSRHNKPEVLPLDVVREEIASAIREERTQEAVSLAAREALSKLRSGTALEAIARESGYEWQVELGAGRRSFAVVPEVLTRVFELPEPAAKQDSSDFVLTAQGDAVVIELARVDPGVYDVLPDQERRQMQSQV